MDPNPLYFSLLPFGLRYPWASDSLLFSFKSLFSFWVEIMLLRRLLPFPYLLFCFFSTKKFLE